MNRRKPSQRSSSRRVAPERATGPDGVIADRLQKVLAAAGIGSRRDCEELITEGRVDVDGKVVTELGTRVDPVKQVIRVDGEALRQPQKLYYVVNKPEGVVTTNYDQAGRTRVVDLVPTEERVFAVGRLDRASEGLIIVTNDGEFANRVTHPRYGVTKTYLVRVAGEASNVELAKLRRGIHLSDGFCKVDAIQVKKRHKQSTDMVIQLSEGKNREIRRILARIGHKVLKLKRLAVGSVKLGELPLGAWRWLDKVEIDRLLGEARLRRKENKKGKTAVTGDKAAAGKPTTTKTKPAKSGLIDEDDGPSPVDLLRSLPEAKTPLSLDDLMGDDEGLYAPARPAGASKKDRKNRYAPADEESDIDDSMSSDSLGDDFDEDLETDGEDFETNYDDDENFDGTDLEDDAGMKRGKKVVTSDDDDDGREGAALMEMDLSLDLADGSFERPRRSRGNVISYQEDPDVGPPPSAKSMAEGSIEELLDSEDDGDAPLNPRPVRQPRGEGRAPRGDRAPRGEAAPRGDRPARGGERRPAGKSGGRPAGKPAGETSYGDAERGPRGGGERSGSERSGGERSGAPRGGRKFAKGGRPGGKPYGDRPAVGRGEGRAEGRPEARGEGRRAPRGEYAGGESRGAPRPEGRGEGAASGGRPAGRPGPRTGGRPTGRPGGKPSGRSGGFRPRGEGAEQGEGRPAEGRRFGKGPPRGRGERTEVREGGTADGRGYRGTERREYQGDSGRAEGGRPAGGGGRKGGRSAARPSGRPGKSYGGESSGGASGGGRRGAAGGKPQERKARVFKPAAKGIKRKKGQ